MLSCVDFDEHETQVSNLPSVAIAFGLAASNRSSVLGPQSLGRHLPDRSSSDEKNYHPRPGRFIRRRAYTDSRRAVTSAPRRTNANIPATESAAAAGRCFAGLALVASAGSERRESESERAATGVNFDAELRPRRSRRRRHRAG